MLLSNTVIETFFSMNIFFLHTNTITSVKFIYIYIFIERSTLLFPYRGNLLQCKLFRNRVIARLQAR